MRVCSGACLDSIVFVFSSAKMLQVACTRASASFLPSCQFDWLPSSIAGMAT